MASFSVIPQEYGGWAVIGRIDPFTGKKSRDPTPIFTTKSLEEAEKKLAETRAKYKEGAARAREKDRAFLASLTDEERAAAGLKPRAPPKPRKKKGEAAAEPPAES